MSTSKSLRTQAEESSRDTNAKSNKKAQNDSLRLSQLSYSSSNSRLGENEGEKAQRNKSGSPKSSADCDSKPKQSTSKKCQKVKYEIDRQNFLIAKLNREIEMKTERNFPDACLQDLKHQLCVECKKLNTMVKCAMEMQNGDERWGEISLSSNAQNLKPPKTPSSISAMSAFTEFEFSDSLLTDNNFLEEERFHLQEELLMKDDSIQDLHCKLERMQCQLIKLCHENKAMAEKLTKESVSGCKQEVEEHVKTITVNTDKLACNLQQLESHLCELRNELCRMKKEKQMALEMQKQKLPEASPSFVERNGRNEEATARPKTCPSNFCESQAEGKLNQLKTQFVALQMEYCRKEKDCKEMSQRMKTVFEKCSGDKEKAENEALKHRADELVAQIEDYKVFVKELQEQVDSSREKFLKAQEKVEYQRYMLENLELNNKDVESQINTEMTKIKEKFHQKLAELCPYPKMYEESHLELKEAKKIINALEMDLKATMAALSKSQCELKTLKEQPDESTEKKYKKLQCEVEMLKAKYDSIRATKECLEEKLTTMKSELESLRKDSSKIITTTKCCAEKNRQILHEQINCLEIDLAQCRASASLSLTEKEEVIKKMKQELASLCSHFNDCQGQIKQLQNQVTYLTNQRHKIRPEDLNKIDCCYPEL